MKKRFRNANYSLLTVNYQLNYALDLSQVW